VRSGAEATIQFIILTVLIHGDYRLSGVGIRPQLRGVGVEGDSLSSVSTTTVAAKKGTYKMLCSFNKVLM